MPTHDEKPNIYPPSIFDPLLPGGIPSTPDPEGAGKDSYLGELARDAETEEAVPGPSLPQEEAASPEPGDLAAPEEEPPTEPTPPTGAEVLTPTGILKQIVLGMVDHRKSPPVAGASVIFCPRPGKWRRATVLRLAGIDVEGNVLVDLEFDAVPSGLHAATSVPLGDGVRNWRFVAG